MSSNSLDIEAVYAALHSHLIGLCGGRVYPDLAPVGTTSPFVVYSFESGGNTDRRNRDNSTLTLLIKCIADRLEDSFSVARQIRDLLQDNGTQGTNTLPVNAEWEITTVTQGLLIHIVETYDNSSLILYHTGHQYAFNLEKLSDG